MKIKPGFKLHTVCGQHIIVAEGKENLDFSNVISMNESSALLWNAVVGKEFTIDDLADILQEHYHIDENTPLPRKRAIYDAKTLVGTWAEVGMVEF